MPNRKVSLPRQWLMTDERGGDPADLARRLPRGAGIVFRHHATPNGERRRLFIRVKSIARQRCLTLLLADTPARAKAWGGAGAHHRSALRSIGLRSVAVHSRRELILAKSVGADLLFVSPVFTTRSHPGGRPMGVVKLGLLVGHDRHFTVALGGIDANRFRRLAQLRLHGWAGIDAFSAT